MPRLKYSRQRECIRENLRSRRDHPTADMIYRDVKREYENISLGTVYRNLALLVDEGEILKLSCGQDVDRYDGFTEPHYHFFCRGCGQVSDLMIPSLGHIDILAGSSFDGRIDGHEAYFYGLCRSCIDRAETAEDPQGSKVSVDN